MSKEIRTPEQMSAGAATAQMLIEISAVNFRPAEPYTFTAGWASPVYIDCRKVISHLDQRRMIVKLGTEMLSRDVGLDSFDFVAGGETAGIPYGAWFSETLNRPMLYVRKKPKGFGRKAQIEGDFNEGDRVLLVEDLATDGGSKINFINALRTAGAEVSDIFVVFFYGAFPGAQENMARAEVKLHYLADWWDVLGAAEAMDAFPPSDLAEVRQFLDDPVGWSAAHDGRAA